MSSVASLPSVARRLQAGRTGFLVDVATMAEAKRAHPLLWVPSLYFAMGTPMIAVSVVSGIMYKDLGLTNTEIGIYTGALYLPWVLKPLWAPLVELFRTKKFFVLAMECAMVVTFDVRWRWRSSCPPYLPLTIAVLLRSPASPRPRRTSPVTAST